MGTGFARARERLRSAAPWLIAAFAFAALHVAVEWQTWLAPSATMRGWPGDNLMFAWNLWWVASATWDLPGAGALHCPIVFHPDGFPFPFHTHTWLHGIVYSLAQAPWRAVGAEPPGPVLAYNGLLLLSTVLSGIAAMLLLGASGVRSLAARFLGALVLVFGSFRMFALYGHLNFAAIEFFLFSAWAHVVAMQRPDATGTWRWGLAGGVFAGLAFLNDATMGIFAGMFGVCALAFAFVRVLRRRASWRILPATLASPTAAFALCAWQIAELLRIGATPDYVVLDDLIERYCEPLNFLLPHEWNVFVGDWSHDLGTRLGIAPGSGIAFLGAAPLGTCVAAVVAFLASRRFRRGSSDLAVFWIATGVAGLVFAVGDALFFRGQRICQWPAHVLHLAPGLSNLRIPERFVLFPAVAMAVAAGHVFDLARSCSSRAPWVAALAAWIPLAAFDAAWKAPHFRADDAPVAFTPNVAAAVRSDEVAWSGAVLELPFSWETREPLFRQTIHHRPIVFGTAARVSLAMIERRYRTWPFLRGFDDPPAPSVALAIAEGRGGEATRAAFADFLAAHDVAWIVVDRARLPDSDELGTLMPANATLALKNDAWLVWSVERKSAAEQ